MNMINANEAVKAAQKTNRDNWLKAAENNLSKEIMSVAKTGLREYYVCLHNLIIGAENLIECAEMIFYLQESLCKAGYSNHLTPDGDIIITW